ncbi:hypothetical protein [Desulfosporosinus sp. FKA]|uniref:hypothetical protein n=1 Tax=Desulfosporosinus sp. FKA TaxID=1969834 RepID=UPI000B498FE5|nr:hypothetical protein [Desulfosporosinus sp. FKA]
MKGKKLTLIPLTLSLICALAIPVYASVSQVESFTNTGAYIGGYSSVSLNFSATKLDEYGVLYENNQIVSTDVDNDQNNLTYAQANVGINNPAGNQNWYIEGTGIVYQGNLYNAHVGDSAVISK